MTNRIYKFRAWDNSEGHEPEMHYFNLGQGFSGMEDCRIMQFTGLLDKNGIAEIYEGDIVRAKLMNGDNHTYVYSVEFITHPAPMFAINGRQMNDDEFEVIGNIYENPSLLPNSPQV